MRFSEVKGNEGVCRTLTRMVDSGKVPHAIMFHEDDGGGAMRIVLAFIQYLYCSSRSAEDSCGECRSCNKIAKLIHPDVHFVFPVGSGALSINYIRQWRELLCSNPDFREDEFQDAMGIVDKNSMIAVAESRALLEALSLSALEGGYRTVLIYLPEKLNQESANRLLKIIEEPPVLTQFLLVTHAPEKVLQTISSRCQTFRVVPSRRPGIVSDEEFAALLDALLAASAKKDLGAMLKAADEVGAIPSREGVKSFCKYAVEELREIFLAQQGLENLGRNSEFRKYATLKKSFPRGAMAAFDRASMLTERNVNQRMIWTDLACTLYKL